MFNTSNLDDKDRKIIILKTKNTKIVT